METDRVHSKRPFAQVATASTYIYRHPSGCYSSSTLFDRPQSGASDRGRALTTKRRLTTLSAVKMPVQTGLSLVSASLDSPFARDFGDPVDCALQLQRQDNRPLFNTQPDNRFLSTTEPPISFEHRESVSSSGISESTDSSPTTTISTFDTTSMTDTSPSSSPESPSALQITYPKSTRIPEITERIAMHHSNAQVSTLSPLPSSMISSTTRPVSPARRARNLKNLSLRMPSSTPRPAISTASVVEVTSQNFSAPPSPIHRPVKTARRKPANLTIRTPASDQSSFSHSIADIIPPTPSIPQRSLRHFESSPSLTSMFSPTIAPVNGMQIPRPATRDGMPLMPGSWQDSPPPPPPRQTQVGPVSSLQQVTEEDDYHLDSRESTKRTEQSYPDGPIKIYESGVYLYLEPTRDEASKFDVVVNVAKEVVNPFADETEHKPETVVSTLRRPLSLAKRLSIAEPMTAISEESFHSAFESLPTTPKVENSSTPEYIHVPWDHNSEILDDLTSLCQLIDDRIAQGKSVLVHCQLGASRSASLVIAYGLYKSRDLDFNDMYSIVKGKSCWVGPNMSLIYQLTDFRSRLQRDEPAKAANQEWFKTPFLSKKHQDVFDSPPQNQEQVQGEQNQEQTQPEQAVPAQPEQVQEQIQTVEVQVERPAFALESIFSPIQPTFAHQFIKPAPPPQKQHGSGVRNILPRPLPLREKYQSFESSIQSSEKPETRRLSHIRFPTVQMDLVMQDVPASPSILSPRAAPYMCSSLSRTLAGDLAGDAPQTLFQFGQPALDPRSPPQRRELLITRNIDEVL
jgi:tyrosine-protein phosphatase MSG5